VSQNFAQESADVFVAAFGRRWRRSSSLVAHSARIQHPHAVRYIQA
jgi:hypothetical protein